MKKRLLNSFLSVAIITLTTGYLTGGSYHYLAAFVGCFIVSLYFNIKEFKKDGNK